MKIQLAPAQAVAISKAIAPAISKEKHKYHLQQIQISPQGDSKNGYATSVRFAATDGFRLHTVELVNSYDPHEWSESITVSGAKLVKALADAAKKDKTGTVNIECVGAGAPAVMVTNTHNDTGMNQYVVCVDMSSEHMPQIDGLLTGSLNQDMELPATYNARYLADMVKSAGAVSEAVKITGISTRRCGRVEATGDSYGDTGLSFVGLLMPQRA